MKKVILSILLIFIISFAGFYIYISTGSYDISQLTPHNALTKRMIKITTKSSINKRMKEVVVPGNLKDTSLILEGFKLYDELCSDCHGGPGINADVMAKGLYPKPPEIYKRVKEEEAQEFFWIIKNGIKMTSMPAYSPTFKDDKIWAITAFVTQKLGKMTADEYKDWILQFGEMEDVSEMQNKEE